MRGLLPFVAFCLAASLFVVPGCGDPVESDPGAAIGEACDDGGQCKSDLFCFQQVDGMPGKCEAIPAACSGDPKCAGGCFDDFKAKCTAGGSSCISFAGTVTLTCAGAP